MDDDFVIKFIEWGLKKGKFTIDDIKNKYGEGSTEFKFIEYENNFLDNAQLMTPCDQQHRTYMISSEARFNYLEHKELKLAQENSKISQEHAALAHKLSLIAIIVAIVSTLFYTILNDIIYFNAVSAGFFSILIMSLFLIVVFHEAARKNKSLIVISILIIIVCIFVSSSNPPIHKVDSYQYLKGFNKSLAQIKNLLNQSHEKVFIVYLNNQTEQINATNISNVINK